MAERGDGTERGDDARLKGSRYTVRFTRSMMALVE